MLIFVHRVVGTEQLLRPFGCLFIVLFLSVWHAAHRLRVVAHDFGIRKDALVANAVYTIATIGTVLAAFYLFNIR